MRLAVGRVLAERPAACATRSVATRAARPRIFAAGASGRGGHEVLPVAGGWTRISPPPSSSKPLRRAVLVRGRLRALRSSSRKSSTSLPGRLREQVVADAHRELGLPRASGFVAA